MIYYLAFGPGFYRIPKSHTQDSLGYGYMLDPSSLCTLYKDQEICKGDSECESEVYSKQKCVDSLNSWLDRVNSKCFSKLNTLEDCNETEKNCKTELHRFLRCESSTDRPSWLLDSSLSYFERLKDPKIAKT
jgi:hypothetical protein